MARMTQQSVTAYIERARKGGWLKSEPKFRKANKPFKAQVKRSVLEERFEGQLRLVGITDYINEHRFCERRWRFDICFLDCKVAVEIEGGIHSRGRHVRPEGFRKDAAKYRRAAILGWLVLRITSHDINSGAALEDLEKALKVRREGVVSLRA